MCNVCSCPCAWILLPVVKRLLFQIMHSTTASALSRMCKMKNSLKDDLKEATKCLIHIKTWC